MTKVAKIKIFDSCEDFASYANENNYMENYAKYSRTSYGRDWAGHETIPEMCNILNGLVQFTKCEDQVNSIIDQLQIEGLFTTGVKMPERYYYGSTPNVTAYLHGLPKAMNRRVPSENSALNTPINIYVETFVSSGLSDGEIVNRGIACAALVMAMQSVRPVNFYVTNLGRLDYRNDDIYGTAVKVSEGVIDTSRMLFMLCTRAYCRQFGFSAMHRVADIPSHMRDRIPPPHAHEEKIKEYLGLTQEDVYITGGHLYDAAMTRNPIQWVRDMIEKKRYTILE